MSDLLTFATAVVDGRSYYFLQGLTGFEYVGADGSYLIRWFKGPDGPARDVEEAPS